MSEIRGEIAFLDERSGKSKKPPYRPFKAYSIKVKQDNGELSERIDGGFLKNGESPPFNKGDYVVVTTKQEGDYLKVDSIAAAQRPAAAAPVAGRSDEGTDESSGADRQTQIVLQHSQEMAIAEVALLIANNALPLSAATNKAGIAKRYEEIHQAIKKLTVEAFFDVVTARLLESVADAGDVQVADVGDLPAAANDDSAKAQATGTDD